MNTRKKLMTLLLVLLSANSMMAHDFEQGGIYYNIIHADEVEVTFMGDSYTSEDKAYSGAVTIPETVTHDGEAYTVTTIGVYAFYECTELTSVELPATVTVIRGAAFMLCSNLTDIVFPDSLYCIEDGVFTGTAWFENLPEGLNYVGRVAYKYKGTMPQNTCVVLKEGTLGIAALAFFNCSGMTDIVIPNTVTYIGMAAFKNCSGLTQIEIPNSVTTIGYQAFVNTPWYDSQPEGLVYAGKVAYLYKGTMPDNTNIVLDEDTRGIATDAFRKCTGLTSVVIPDAVVNIGDGAFMDCGNLKSVSIGKSVDFIGEAAFNHCSALESITVASDNPHFDSRNDCNAIIETRINKLVVGCRNTVMPDNIVRIGLQAFYYCSALESVELPNTLTVIEDMAFTNCSGLTSLVIPNSVTDIRYYAFSGCSGLTSVVIPDAVVKLGAGAFGGCSSLTSLEIPKYLTEIKDYTFVGCSSLTSVEIPDSVVTIGARAFASCKKLDRVTIGKSVASIGVRGFANIDALTTVTCLAMTPPVAETDSYYDDWCFDDWCFNNATLYVPADAIDDYRNAPTWERFINIQPISTPSDVPGDVNGDGEVNIADINAVINIILSGGSDLSGDVNGDGEVNIADINAIIAIILGGGDTPTPDEHEWVDLGLPSGTLWATCNVGATSPEGYGSYFAWGETEPKQAYDWSNYKWGNYLQGGLLKYVTDSENGTVDYKTELEPEDDAATANWGPMWRMPSSEQQSELYSECSWEWTSMNDVNGYMVTGPNGNTLFLPAAGCYEESSNYYEGSSGDYWSRSLRTNLALYARTLHLYGGYYGNVNLYEETREKGLSVRAVRVPQD